MTAVEYNAVCLQKLSKPELIVLVLSHRDETNATIDSLRDELMAMNKH